MFLNLKSVVLFLKISLSLLLSRPLGFFNFINNISLVKQSNFLPVAFLEDGKVTGEVLVN